MRDNIFIAFSNKKTALSIAKIIISEGMPIKAVLKNITDLTNTLSYYRDGIIFLSYVFDDVYIDNILELIPDGFTVILIGNREQINSCDNEDVLKLAVPLRKVDLICALDMISSFESSYKLRDKKTDDEKKIIDNAKHYLMDAYSMSESQAHRYIQKKSMDTGKKLADIAKIILNI